MTPLTPMMQQYMETKKQYPDCILFYRLGDFYEMFYEDALIASKELEITLTGKNCGQEERAPMCGVPHHAMDTYLNRLVNKGYRVAICEQVEDPKTVKGIVKREVVRIATPGTNLNTGALDESKNNYLMGIVCDDTSCGISVADITTGDYFVTEAGGSRKVLDEIMKYMPSEIICSSAFFISGIDIKDLTERFGITVLKLDDSYVDLDACDRILKEHFKTEDLDTLGLSEFSIGICAAGMVIKYLYDTQKNALSHFTRITPYTLHKFMLLDSFSRRNLELTETLREKQKKGSLLGILDKTKTAMGARLLRSIIEQPLIDYEEIDKRLDAVAELKDSFMLREEIREYLNAIYDLERLAGKISYKNANPRDLIAFRNSLAMLPHIRQLGGEFKTSLLSEFYQRLDTLSDLYELIDASIEEEPPIAVKEGGIIKSGYHQEVDELRKAKTEGKDWLAELEAREKETTGIKNLRIKFNRVFGYYLEVTNSYASLVPERWVRKQTLANAERYTTPELKDLEDKILNAEEKLYSLEYELFVKIRDSVAGEVERIQQTAKIIAKLDVFCSFAFVAERNGYIRPVMNQKGVIDIKNGRHPVVEQVILNGMFIANDTYLDNEEKRLSIITGPNMAGKSTYMRQTALIVLMAQIGCFVPAEKADIGIVDRIFTRVGASDDLASGQSTFMVEMTEVANILANATKNSLLILDEIGRGTSTFDGLSIAWAVVEHISNVKLLGAKTLFATHYHELTELEGKLDGVNNYCIAVKEQGEDVVFLRKIVHGGADKSYGIQVARLAGIPESVLKRAFSIVNELSNHDILEKAKNIAISTEDSIAEEKEDFIRSKPASVRKRKKGFDPEQLSLFKTEGYEEIANEIRNMNIDGLTPLEGLNKLYEIQKRLKDVL